jgi:hypothetical protein
MKEQKHGTAGHRRRGALPADQPASKGAAPIHRFNQRQMTGQGVWRGHPLYRPLEKTGGPGRCPLASRYRHPALHEAA